MSATLIFDYDGTIHDTFRIYRKSFLKAYHWLIAEGKAPQREFADDEISCWLGFNSKVMWSTFMPELEEDYKEQVSRIVGEEMIRLINAGEAKLYDGAEDVLKELKGQGYRMVLLSNCKEAYCAAHRAYFGLDRFFEDYYCCESYGFIPKGEIMPRILNSYPGPYLSIGDRFSDYDAAAEHNIPFIGCLYGFGKPEEFEKAHAVIESVEDITKTVENINL